MDRFIHDSEFRSRIIHSSLGIVGTVVNGANYVNALLYAVEGNGKEAAKSLMFGLAGSSVQKIKGFTGFFLKDTKAAATTASVMKAVGTGYALDLAATDFANKAEAMLEKYWIDGADITWDTAAEALDLTCSGLQMGNYINQFYRSGSDALGEVKDLLKDSKAGAYLNNIWNDNRGMIDAEVLCGGSGTTNYYHSCGDDVADIIAENGFRTDIPNPQAAFNNNRYGRGVYLADSPTTALAERPGGTILKVNAETGKI